MVVSTASGAGASIERLTDRTQWRSSDRDKQNRGKMQNIGAILEKIMLQALTTLQSDTAESLIPQRDCRPRHAGQQATTRP